MAGYDPDALLASPPAQASIAPVAAPEPASTSQGYDPDALLASSPAPYHGDTTASLQNDPGGIGEWLGGLGRPKAGTDATVFDHALGTVGSAIHGVGEVGRGALTIVNKLDPDILAGPGAGGDLPSGVEYGDTEQAKQDQIDRAKTMESYQQNYNIGRPGEIDKEGHNTSPDPVSDITQGLTTATLVPGMKVAGYWPELANAIGTGILSSILMPSEDKGGTESVPEFLKDKGKQALVGGIVGAGAKHVGDIISPNVNAQTKLLLDRDINPTIGDVMQQSPNPITAALGKTETLSSGLPFVGGPIQKAQEQAILDLNKAVANSSLKDAGLPVLEKTHNRGTDIANEVHDKFTKAYDEVVPKLKFDQTPLQQAIAPVPPTPFIPAKRKSVNFPNGQPAVPATPGIPGQPLVPDPFTIALEALQQTAKGLGTEREGIFNEIVQNHVTSSIAKNGTMTGRNLKGALSDIRREYKGFQGSEDYKDRRLGDHLENLYDAMKDNMVRHSAPEDVAALTKLDQGYQKYAGIIRPGAAKASVNGGTYTPAQMAMVSRQADGSVAKGATARGVALEQPLAQAAAAVLAKLADSQTTNRYASGKFFQHILQGIGLGTGGSAAYYGGPAGVAALLGGAGAVAGASSLAYTRPAQKAMVSAMTSRQGAGYKAVSDAVTNKGAMVAAPLADDLSGQSDRSTPSTDNQMQALLQPQEHREGGLVQHFAEGGAVSEDPTYTRNRAYVRPDAKSFKTDLGKNEAGFQTWIMQNKIPFDPSDAKSDYDMRGYYKALLDGDTAAHQSLNDNDGRMHFPDTYKTPYHQSFSNESKYATPDAPSWANDSQLVDKNGNVVFDEKRAQ